MSAMNAESEMEFLQSLDLPPLSLDIFASPCLEDQALLQTLCDWVEKIGPHFLRVAKEENVFEVLGLDPENQAGPGSQGWELELGFVTNPEMQVLNREYRGKDQPTDVLTFTLLADASGIQAWTQLPVVQLGSIFISLDWAREAVSQDKPSNTDEVVHDKVAGLALERYLMERFVHGLLHLAGIHHDTMEAYQRVVAIQKRVLDAVFTHA